MNHGEPDDSEIVSGDEGDLTPIEDITESGGDFGVVPEAPVVVDEVVEAVPELEPEIVEAPVEEQAPVVDEPAIPVEVVTETPEPIKTKRDQQGILGLLFGGSTSGRLNSLTQAIEDAPESAVNYMLRGEVYTSMHEYALAQSDFQQAISLSETQFELADWGLLEQAMRDRAIAGLEKVQRRLR